MLISSLRFDVDIGRSVANGLLKYELKTLGHRGLCDEFGRDIVFFDFEGRSESP